jgi:hypothetical protein
MRPSSREDFMMGRWKMLVVLGCIVSACLVSLSHAQTTKPDTTAVKRPLTKPVKSVAGVKGIRTIDAINIEGEIVVPQVLFITSRDNRRYRDGLGKNFRMGTLDVARSLTMPNRLCVAGSQNPKSMPVNLKEE